MPVQVPCIAKLLVALPARQAGGGQWHFRAGAGALVALSLPNLTELLVALRAYQVGGSWGRLGTGACDKMPFEGAFAAERGKAQRAGHTRLGVRMSGIEGDHGAVMMRRCIHLYGKY